MLLRRAHGRSAQYSNPRRGRSGHLWQNRFFVCPLEPGHLWAALAYVERNPVRAGMVRQAAEYRWSSAAAHRGAEDRAGIPALAWWAREKPADWAGILQGSKPKLVDLLACTYAGRPSGDGEFRDRMRGRFGRQWTPGRPGKDGVLRRAGRSDSSRMSRF